MDAAVAALTAEHAELAGLLAGLTEPDWHAATRCEGWDVADVVLHLAQTDEMAIASATGTYSEVIAGLAPGWGTRPRSMTVPPRWSQASGDCRAPRLAERWSSGAHRLVGVLDAMDLSTRVDWVAGELSARTLATTRLAETWIHAGDVAGAVGGELPATDRLRPIARLAWRTLPYAFTSAGRTAAGPVAFRLVSPDGDRWDFLPDGPAVTTISGPAAELCAVAARRVEPSATSLGGEGPDVEAVLALVRTYA